MRRYQIDRKNIKLSKSYPRLERGWNWEWYKNGDMVAIFWDNVEGSYGYCFHGVYQGLSYQTEDVLGFASVDEAEAAARRAYRRLRKQRQQSKEKEEHNGQ